MHRIHRAALVAAGLFLITALGPLARPAQAAPVPPSSDVQVAQQWVAGWIGRQVQADQAKITNSQTGEIDYSHIAGAVWALASTGLARNEIEAAAQVLLNSGPTFIGPAAEASTQWGHVATVALALQVAGHDPTAYPAGDGTTRDLIAELRSVIAADGSPGASATGYSGALLVLALARSPEGVPANLVTWLKAQPCADPGSPNFGAFGFTGPGSCDSGDTDSTALAIQGLLAAGVPTTDPAITGAQTYLEINQEVGGGWGTPGFTPANAMSTGLVVQALRPLGSPAVAKGEQYLLTLIVGCNPNGPSPAFGAMAYDAAGLTGLDLTSPDPAFEVTALEASIQGLLGLGAAPLGEISAAGASDVVPMGACPTNGGAGLPEASPGDNPVIAPGPSLPAYTQATAGWWIGGGLAVLLLIGALAGVALSRRPAHDEAARP